MRGKEFVPENYEKIDVGWKITALNGILLFLGLFAVSVAIFAVPFFIIHAEITQAFRYDFVGTALDLPIVFAFPTIIGGLIVHEFIHGLFYSFYCKDGFKSIKFGLDKQSLSVYAACMEVIPTSKFLIGLTMPMIIVGIVPAVISIFIGSVPLLVFGLVFTGMSAGDMHIVSKIHKNNRSTWFHNYEFLLYKPK